MQNPPGECTLTPPPPLHAQLQQSDSTCTITNHCPASSTIISTSVGRAPPPPPYVPLESKIGEYTCHHLTRISTPTEPAPPPAAEMPLLTTRILECLILVVVVVLSAGLVDPSVHFYYLDQQLLRMAHMPPRDHQIRFKSSCLSGYHTPLPLYGECSPGALKCLIHRAVVLVVLPATFRLLTVSIGIDSSTYPPPHLPTHQLQSHRRRIAGDAGGGN